MALETRPAWVVGLMRTLGEAYTTDEVERLRRWAEQVQRLNDGQRWRPGTFQGLIDMARAEDAARDDE